jgi:hypothetical protein
MLRTLNFAKNRSDTCLYILLAYNKLVYSYHNFLPPLSSDHEEKTVGTKKKGTLGPNAKQVS